MNFIKEQLNLYLVTDRHWLANRNLEDDVEKAILGGVTMVQLREKNIDKEDVFVAMQDFADLQLFRLLRSDRRFPQMREHCPAEGRKDKKFSSLRQQAI